MASLEIQQHLFTSAGSLCMELEYLTPQEAATLMRCSKVKLAKDRAARPPRGLPFVKFGAKVLYPRADLTRFLELSTTNPRLK